MAKKVIPLLSWLFADLGERGERLAARELERRGYQILERRWRAKRGEIDIVAKDGEVLVIVEVKTRTREDNFRSVDAVDIPKQRALVRLAEAYVKARRLNDVPVRFDVVGVLWPKKGPRRVEVLKDAFSA